MGRPFFEYRTDEADAIHDLLQRAGLQYEEHWPGYRAEIERRMRQALAIEERNLPGHLPYAPQAAKQLASLAQALSESARRYKTLPDELQLTLDAEVETVLLQDPLLALSVSASAQPLVVLLLSSGRFPLVLNAVKAAAESKATILAHAGKPSAVSPATLKGVSQTVARAVRKAAKARRPDGLFPHNGAPRNRAIRWAVGTLYRLYWEATGKKPTAYTAQYTENRYGGQFHAFARLALRPVRLVSDKVLDANILAMYREIEKKRRKRP